MGRGRPRASRLLLAALLALADLGWGLDTLAPATVAAQSGHRARGPARPQGRNSKELRRQDKEAGPQEQELGHLVPPPHSHTIPESTCQTEYMDILGGDLNDGRLPGQRTRTPAQCQQRCQEANSCGYWAWDMYAGSCWLKRSDGLRIPHPKIIIGPKFCPTPLAPPSIQPAEFAPNPVPSSGSVKSKSREPCAVTIDQDNHRHRQQAACKFDSPYQTINGRCNNIKQPNWGAADIPFSRLASPIYGPDGSEPRASGPEYPNVRVVGGAFPDKNNPDGRVSSMIMQFAQFLAHDVAGTSFPEKHCCLNPNRPECFNIYVPNSDNTYPMRHNLSSTCIDFARSSPACGHSSREQVNTITAFIDSSNVYGSDEEVAQVLRSHIGGRLVENANSPGQLPTNDQLRRPSHHLDDRHDFVSGDLRVNEQPFLTSMHVLFMREHNRLADLLAKELHTENDELLYQSARKLVIIEMQNIVYREFLPTLLGKRFMEKYKLDINGDSKYNPNANPSVLNSFSTVAFRFGHSMINGLFKVILTNQEIFWRLSDLFNGKKFNGKAMLDIEPMILGLLHQNAQKVDGSFADELTNHLFTEHSPKRHTHFGGDLVARNLQRGRDHGIPDYNTFRKICNLAPITSFDQKPLEMSHDMWNRFKSLYRNVGDIDLYMGGISEIPVDSDALLGPTFSCLIGLQFHNMKYGDRFFFSHRSTSLNYLQRFMLEMETRTLSQVICSNTNIERVQGRAFESPHKFSNPVRDCRRSQESPPTQTRQQPVQTTPLSASRPATELPPPVQVVLPAAGPKRQPERSRVPKSLEALSLTSSQLGLSPSRPPPFKTPSIFEAFRNFQQHREFFPRVSNITISRPVKFLERFDHADAILDP